MKQTFLAFIVIFSMGMVGFLNLMDPFSPVAAFGREEANSGLLFFATIKKGHNNIFDEDGVKESYLFFENIMPGYDLCFVEFSSIAAARRLVPTWRSLPYVDSVERDNP